MGSLKVRASCCRPSTKGLEDTLWAKETVSEAEEAM